jgi:hypothetical protein
MEITQGDKAQALTRGGFICLDRPGRFDYLALLKVKHTLGPEARGHRFARRWKTVVSV